jgi:hypothetical protein
MKPGRNERLKAQPPKKNQWAGSWTTKERIPTQKRVLVGEGRMICLALKLKPPGRKLLGATLAQLQPA